MKAENIIARKNCRIDYVNGYSVLVDFTASPNVIIYYERRPLQLNQLYSIYSYKKRNEMPLDLYQFTFFTYSITQ